MKRTILFSVMLLVIIAMTMLTGCQSADAKNKYEETLVAYLEAMKEGTEKAIEYTTLPNETVEYDYLHSNERIADYEITSSREINNQLYAFTLNIATTDQPNVYTPLYYFVGQQDGAYTVYINVNYVPESLCENLVPGDYSYDNPDYLGGTPEFDT